MQLLYDPPVCASSQAIFSAVFCGEAVKKKSNSELSRPFAAPRIAEAYEDDPASAAAEYGAEFRDDIAEFVPRSVIATPAPFEDGSNCRRRPECTTRHLSIRAVGRLIR